MNIPSRKMLLTVLSGFTVVGSLVCAGNLTYIIGHKTEAEKNAEKYGASLELMIPSLYSSDNACYGKIYTLDGKNMLQRFRYKHDDDTGEYIEINIDDDAESEVDDLSTRFDDDRTLYIPTQPYYSNIVGLSGSYGLLYDTRNILKSYSLEVNRRRNEGDYLITTIYSPAQAAAYYELQDYVPLAEEGTFASIAVVSADGAILVDAGTNADAAYDYICNDMREYMLISHYDEDDNYISAPVAGEDSYIAWDLAIDYPDFTGSSFKPITARVLEQNDKELSSEYSVRNSDYIDNSWTDLNGEDIGNHDAYRDESDKPVKVKTQRSLAQALIDSSNVYFLDHSKKLGLDKYQSELERLFKFDSYENIGTCLMDPIFFSTKDPQSNYIDVNIGKVTYGQSARLSPVRLASSYNTAVSGVYYKPFLVSQIRTPEYDFIYKMNTQSKREVRMDINISNDIVVDGMRAAYNSYMGTDEKRFLSKSGTADVDEEKGIINRTMTLTVLNEDCTEVVCTAVISINHLQNTRDEYNSTLVWKLMNVVEALGVV